MYSMNYIGKFINNFREFYNEINGATLTGAIDVVVVEQPDGSFSCSPFHVRFGKLGVLRSRFKVVDLELNGEPLDVHMKLGESGEAFFVEEIPEDELESSAHLATSPIPDNGFSMFTEEMSLRRRNSVSEYPQDKLENQVSEYTKRRYTDGTDIQRPDLTLNIPKRDYQTYKELKSKFNDYTPSPTSQDQEPIFQMEGLDETPRSQEWKSDDLNASSPLTPSTPKTFRAEELGTEESAAKDVIRKISIHNDFRPIEVVEKQENAFQKKTDDAPLDESQKNTTNNGKKKKKTKKSGTKKKNPQRKSSTSSNSSLSDATANNETENKVNERLNGSIVPDDKPLSAVPKILQEHFFSDSEINSGGVRSPTSRSCTPAQSDTELEMSRAAACNSEITGGTRGALMTGQSWRWGELPEPPMQSRPTGPSTAPAPATADADDIAPDSGHTSSLPESPPSEAISSDEDNPLATQAKQAGKGKSAGMLSGMFSFMKHRQSDGGSGVPGAATNITATTGATIPPTGEGGVYLADIADGGVDPEVAALYFPQHYQTKRPAPLTVNVPTATEEDYESGNGPSLPQSPTSVEGRSVKGLDSDEDDMKYFTKGYIGLSMCGPLDAENMQVPVDIFESEAVRWEELCSDPLGLVGDSRLVVRLGDRYMQWSAAAPFLLSLLVYHRSLPLHVLSDTEKRQRKLSEAGSGGSAPSGGESAGSGAGSGSEGGDANKQQRGYSWWSWRRSTEKQRPAEQETGQALDLTTEVKDEIIATEDSQDTKIEMDKAEEKNETQQNPSEETASEGKMADVSMQTSLPSLEVGGYSGSQSSDESDTGATMTLPTDTAITTTTSAAMRAPRYKHHHRQSTDKFRKSLRLSSDQIARLNLREGMNEVVFSVTTAYQGTTRCKCHLFRWRYDDKIVISDIDGTITKSDVLGHIFPLVGKDWAQSGVAQLFTKIKNNGYKLLYLSARAIGQAKVTREYLRSIKQGDLSLPDGPLLLNPTSLLRAFHREVIEKKPEEFKIQCLSDIKALFPTGSNPFYAGYGNRVNDVCAYQTVGIPIVRIFTINHKGELKHELTQTFQSSYSNMSYIVDQLFPPVLSDICEDFSQCIYWREPLPTIDCLLPLTAGIPPLSSPLPTIPEGSSS